MQKINNFKFQSYHSLFRKRKSITIDEQIKSYQSLFQRILYLLIQNCLGNNSTNRNKQIKSIAEYRQFLLSNNQNIKLIITCSGYDYTYFIEKIKILFKKNPIENYIINYISKNNNNHNKTEYKNYKNDLFLFQYEKELYDKL